MVEGRPTESKTRRLPVCSWSRDARRQKLGCQTTSGPSPGVASSPAPPAVRADATHRLPVQTEALRQASIATLAALVGVAYRVDLFGRQLGLRVARTPARVLPWRFHASASPCALRSGVGATCTHALARFAIQASTSSERQTAHRGVTMKCWGKRPAFSRL